ncbi:MAG TPA: preprotein translocase subunit YajC, partial [Gemmatimonadaceae bacterium]|nr:preprotein translocase subunit YajC [Gemmatimonadaceae bacterium]
MSPTLPLFLQASAGGAAAGNPWPQIILQIGLIVMIFYFLMIRPQQKQRKEQENALFNLKKGDEIVTVGGLVGEILRIKETLKEGIPQKTLEDRITLKTGDSTVVIHRGRV